MKNGMMAVAGLVLAALTATAAVSDGAAWYADEGSVYYPTAGVVGRSAGTVEVTIVPAQDLKDDPGGWPFAFLSLGKEKRDDRRTILGIYYPTRMNFADRPGITALGRTEAGAATGVDTQPDVKAGERVNYAVTWGPSGEFRLYRDGRLISARPFKSPLFELSPYLEVCNRSPLFAEKIRVCDRELAANELAADSSVAFGVVCGATLVANDLDAPQFIPSAALAAKPIVMPFAPFAQRVVREGEPIRVDFAVANAGAATAVHGEMTLGGRKFPVAFDVPSGAAGRKFSITLPPQKAGYHAAEAFGCSFRVSVLPRPISESGALADYLGISFIPDAALVSACGIRWERLWNEHELLWYQVEPQRGKWDFRSADRAIDGAVNRGIRLLATLGYGPAWAVEEPTITPENEKMFSTSVGTYKPKDLAAWDNYVQTVATRYRDKIDHWEIWNEVDWMPPIRAASFTGTPADYLELLKRAHGKLKAVDPSNTVVVSGFGTGASPTAHIYADLCKMGATDYCDVWNMHAYMIRSKAAEYRDVPRRYKPGMPVWQTEFMWHVLSDPVRRAYLGPAIHNWFLEEGYAKFFEFGIGYLTDRHTHSLEAPMHTVAVHQSYLSGCDRFLGRLPDAPAADFDIAHAFRRTDGTYLAMVGSSAGKYEIRLSETPLEVRDMYGAPVAPAANGKLVLDGAFLYAVTRKPPKVADFSVVGTNQLVPNAGFEDLMGDDLDGIDKCRFEGWQIRTQRDPQGFVGVTNAAISGRYSARLVASAADKSVYLFQPIRLPGAGAYRMTAKARVVTGKPKAFLRLFEQKQTGRLWNRDIPLAGKTGTDGVIDLHFNVTVDSEPDVSVAAIVGIDGPGEVVIDDVRLTPCEPVAFDEDDAVLTVLPKAETDLRRGADERIDLSAASPLGTGVKYFGGVPYRLTEGWLVAAGDGWRGAKTQAEIALPGIRVSEIRTLGGVMFQAADCTTAAEIELVYDDGTTARLPFVCGRDVRDWFLVGHPEAKPSVKWEAPGSGLEYGLFNGVLRNPHPAKPLTALRLVSCGTGITALKALTLRRAQGKDLVGEVGVAMRYDDNHKVAEWKALAKQFEDRGLRMALAVIPNSRHWMTPEHWKTLKELADRGHEIMDHTPQHALYRLDYETKEEYEVAKAKKYPFVVDCNDGSMRLYCLGKVDLEHPLNRWFRASAKGRDNDCILTVTDAKDRDLVKWTNKIWIPSLKKFFGVAKEGDRLILRDFWCRGVELNVTDEEMLLVSDRAFEMPDELLRLQTERSRKAFVDHGLPPPRTWCQPGGWEPFVPATNVARICGGEFDYNGGTASGSAKRTFAYGDPNGAITRFAISPCWTYFDDGSSLEQVVKAVRDVMDDGRVAEILSHMSHKRTGGWENWLKLNGEFLDWLKREGIPVRTPSEWSDIVYGKMQSAKGKEVK